MDVVTSKANAYGAIIPKIDEKAQRTLAALFEVSCAEIGKEVKVEFEPTAPDIDGNDQLKCRLRWRG